MARILLSSAYLKEKLADLITLLSAGGGVQNLNFHYCVQVVSV